MQTIQPSVATRRHPLDPLSADEVEAASTILKAGQGLDSDARFVSVALHEPDKSEVLAFKAGGQIDRQAKIVIRHRTERATYEAIVSVTNQRVVSWKKVPGVQPSAMQEEFLIAEEKMKQDVRWQEAMRKRGVTDFDLVILDPWSVGHNGPEDDADKGRFVQPLTWVRSGPGEHSYARPVEGLLTRFDLDRMEVVEVKDFGVVPLATRKANYEADQISDPQNVPSFPDGPRKDLKDLQISQPEGTSFTVEGNLVQWQKWSFRVGFTPREGMVLHLLQYREGDRLRPIIYRASMNEMFVPYGDPNPTHYRKQVFDMGEYGVGMLCNSLELGCDCLGEIHYFNGVVNDNDGNPYTITNAVCLHEEDAGILWKHMDFRTGETEVRRSRRLVLSTIATVGNYEYGYFWYFYQDGTIGYEVKMTGVISNGAVTEGDTPKFGSLVAPGVYGPNHQHWFNMRLDMMVDGLENTVYEVDGAQAPEAENPHGNAWVVKQTPFQKESEAKSRTNQHLGRTWKIANPNKKNLVGEPVAYKLMPGDNVLPFFKPDSSASKRAQFTTNHLWVTAYDRSELYAAGDYPNQNPGGDGLPAYQAADRPLENTDVVVWYSFGAHHPVRPEDWPVMPVIQLGFQLRPNGFFDGNPGLDVPSTHSAHHAHHNGQ